jgi:Bacteriophage baseplate protein W
MVNNRWLSSRKWKKIIMHKSFPFRINNYGHIHESGNDAHIREMMEQILFTVPGERVNRPEFGCGVQMMVFGSTQPEVMSVKQTGIHSELQKYLGHLIQLQEVKISAEESRINILIRYISYADECYYEAEFSR